jgi:hypothetical protein
VPVWVLVVLRAARCPGCGFSHARLGRLKYVKGSDPHRSGKVRKSSRLVTPSQALHRHAIPVMSPTPAAKDPVPKLRLTLQSCGRI